MRNSRSTIFWNKVAVCTLVWFLSACGSGDSEQKETEKKASSVAAPALSCEQQVDNLRVHLESLRTAEAAIDADPLNQREGAKMASATAVSIPAVQVISPFPEVFVVEATAKGMYVDNAALEPYPDNLTELTTTLTKRFEKALCSIATTGERELGLIAHPDVSWKVVQAIVQAADNARAPQIMLGFTAASKAEVPTAQELATATKLDPDVAFAGCPAAIPALAGDAPAGQIESALITCRCRVSPKQVGAYAYARSALAGRDGRLPVALAFTFTGIDANPANRRTPVYAAADAPWSEASRHVIAAIRGGGPLAAGIEGAMLDDKALTVIEAHTRRKNCKLYAMKQVHSDGVMGTLQPGDGNGFASLVGTGDFSSGLDDAQIFGSLLGDDKGGFGFGKSGFGPGGGGSGWGTIGTGGGKGGKRTSSPQVRIGKSTVTGSLDKNIVRRYIRRKLPRIKYCYEKQLLVKPGLAGKLTAKFNITSQGSVVKSTASGVDKKVSSCIAGVIKAIKFPKPKDGNAVDVMYPFTFRPTGG